MGRDGRRASEGVAALEPKLTYTLDDVLSLGFEAQCAALDGTRFLWHGSCGLRVDALTAKTVLLADPVGLPEAPWVATHWGRQEIEEGR